MKKCYKKIGLAFASVMFSLFVAEVGIRVLDPPPHPLAPIRVDDIRASENPILVYDYRPKTKSKGTGNLDNSYFNFEGLRDREHGLVKASGTRRIICIGDSTTAGNGVKNNDDRFTYLLEKRLNNNSNNPVHYEIFNMGVTGYQTVQEVETLRTKGLKYQPDLVLLTVCLNDFRMGGSFFRIKEKESRDQLFSSRTISDHVVQNSRLAFFVHHRLFAQPSHFEMEYRRTQLEGECPVERGMRQLAELQQEHRFAVCVVVLPIFANSFEKYPKKVQHSHEQVAEIVSRYPQIHFTDLKSDFQQLPEPPPYYACDRLHLNEIGHQEMTEMLLPIVRDIMESSVPPRFPEAVSSKVGLGDNRSRN
jgi:lysophospholipase L1-like esterase